jgi:hypothetical protein
MSIKTITDLHSYRRPSRARVHFWDPLARFMIRRGPGARRREPGRQRLAAVDGRRYIVSMWGESQWARNLRAGATATLGFGSRSEPIEGNELVDGEEKTAVVLAICRQYPSIARAYFKVNPKQVTPDLAVETGGQFLIEQPVPV